MAEERISTELAAPPVNQVPWCIASPILQAPLELKLELIYLLPKFRGLTNEDPYKHLKEFHYVCSSMMPQGVSEDQIKLRAFPFSLDDAAKDWFLYLPVGSITTWEDMMKSFLEKFFPTSRVIYIRREICRIKQKESETLYEYWERFKRLYASCPQHDLPEQFLIHYFYEGLLSTERRTLDVASGGSIMNKTPSEAKELISIMAANSQQFGVRQEYPRRVNEVTSYSLESKINQLTNLVQCMVIGQAPQAKVCGICAMRGHPTDTYPTLQEDTQPQVNAIGGFQLQQQRGYDLFSNTYNLGWRDHPNFSYEVMAPDFHNFQHRPVALPLQQASVSKPSSSLEDIVKSLAMSTQQFQNEACSRIQNLENQVSQLATSLSKLESQGKLTSQPEVNWRQNISSTFTLRSGKELEAMPEK